MVTPLEVIDTAVKIGLGALITGVMAYLVTRLNHSKEVEKAKAARRWNLLEGVAEQVEAFTRAAISYWAITAERAEHERRGSAVPADRLAMWKEEHQRLRGIFTELSNAEAKLLLLGEEECQQALRAYGEYVKDFRRRYFPESEKLKTTEDAEFEEHRTNMLKKRAALFHHLSGAYKR